MFKKKCTKRIILASMLIGVLACTGCSKSEKKEENTSDITATPTVDEEATVVEDSIVNPGNEENDEAGKMVEQALIENLAAHNVYQVNWYTTEGDYEAGTSFVLDSKTHGKKLLVTAFHYLCPEDMDSITGSELPDYVLGGEIYNAYSGEKTTATLKDCLVIQDAEAVPAADKDVAAFSIQGGDDLKTLPLCESGVNAGDTVYLLANLWDTDDVNENCVYEGTVIKDDGGILYYTMDEKYGTKGASGAPIVNSYGEVVAIHMASNGSTRIGHSAQSFLAQIDQGSFANKQYPAEFSSLSADDNSSNSESESEYINLTREETLDTTFFKLNMNKVTVTNEINGTTAPDGYQYIVVDITLDANKEIAEQIDMYDDDFCLVWGQEEDDYCYPMQDKIMDQQLDTQYYIYAGEPTDGCLVYEIPTDVTNSNFVFQDYYFEGDSDEITYGDIFVVDLPVENWSR